jgi:hypothetical protein
MLLEWLHDVIKDGAPHLLEVSKDPDPDIRRASLTAFGRLAQHGQEYCVEEMKKL